MIRNREEHPAEQRNGKRKSREKRRRRLLLSLAAVVVFVTTYALILPAFTMEETVYCGYEEAHGEGCYETAPLLVCGQEEGEGHSHTEDCCGEEQVLTCGKALHRHSQQCFSNPNAPVLEVSDVEGRFDEDDLTGDWRDDLVTVAESQMGVAESEERFTAAPDGERLGSNPYSEAVRGEDCAEWNTDFVAFCLTEAGVDRETVPVEENCYDWMDTLSSDDVALFRAADGEGERYTPEPGDLVFHLDDNGDPAVGVITEVKDPDGENTKLKAVEGDTENDRVERVTIREGETEILGYAQLPDDPAPETISPTDEGKPPVQTMTADEPSTEGETSTEEEGAVEAPAGSDLPSMETASPVDDGEASLPSLEERVDRWLTEKTTEHFTKTAVCEEGVTVSVDGSVASLPFPAEEITLTAEVVRDSATIDAMRQTAAQQGLAFSGQLMLDVCLWHNGTVIEPCGPVQVRFFGYAPAENALHAGSTVDEVQVYHMDTEEATLTDMGAEVDSEGTMTVETDHFSFYVLGYTVREEETPGSYQYEKVTELAEINPSDQYVIVANDRSALTYGASNYTTAVTVSPVSGEDDRYTIVRTDNGGGVPDSALWSFAGGSTGGGKITTASGGQMLLGRTGPLGTSSDNVIRYSYGNGWTFQRSSYLTTYYLSWDGTAFGSVTDSGRAAGLALYRQSVVPGETFTEEILNVEEDMRFTGEEKPEALKVITPAEAIRQSGPVSGLERVEMTAASDRGTSDLESDAHFKGSPTENGKILTDKSVTYGGNPYYDFGSYAYDEFSVTLSALSQQYAHTKTDEEITPVDVVLVLDISGSMQDNHRASTVVEATNTLINSIMGCHSENRVGIVTYSFGAKTDTAAKANGDGYAADLKVLMDLSRYYVGGSAPDNSKYTEGGYQYLTLNSNVLSTAANLRNQNHSPVSNSVSVTGGTFTQRGIQLGASLLLNNRDTTYTVKLSDGTTHTEKRTPVIILLSDGEPTCCTENYRNPMAGGQKGNGVASYNTGRYDNTPEQYNAKGIMGFYTVLTANYFKDEVAKHYGTDAAFYTIGMGISETGDESDPAVSGTSDYYKRAVLNPTARNMALLASDTTDTRSVTAVQLYQLLHNQYSLNKTVRVKAPGDYGSYNTVSVTPIANPYYTRGYSYADDSFFSTNYSPEALAAVYGKILYKAMDRTVYVSGFSQREGETDLVMTDRLGEGMELTTAPVLMYDNNAQGISYSDRTEQDGVVTYTYSGVIQPSRYADPVELDGLKVEVYPTPEGNQEVRWSVPGSLVPAFTKSRASDWFYGEYPVRLLYKVGLTEDAKERIAGADPRTLRENPLVFYTNAYTPGSPATATADYHPSGENTYYTAHRDTAIDKEAGGNPTETSSTSYELFQSGTAGEDDAISVQTVLGNNGKLVFTGTKPEPTVTVEKVWANGNENHVADEVEIALYRVWTDESGQMRREWVKTFVLNCQNDWRDSIPVPTEGEQYDVVETKGAEIYSMRSEQSVDEDGSVTITVTNTPDSYRLPETGGGGTATLYGIGGVLLTLGAVGAGWRRRE